MKLPRYTAATPPPRETGLVRAQDIGALTRTGGAEFEAIAGAGKALQDVADIAHKAYMGRQALDDQQKMGEISIKAQDAEKEGADSIGLIDIAESRPLPDDPDYYKGDKIPDSETWAKNNESVFTDYKKKIISLSTAIKNPKKRQKWVNTQLIRGSSNFGKISRAKYDEYQQYTILSYARTAASNGDIELSNKWIEIAEKHGLIGPKRAAQEKLKNEKAMKAAVVENIKPMLIAAIAVNNKKEDGYTILDSSIKELVKDGVLTEAEAAEANKKLGDWMDNYVAGRIKDAKEAEKLTTIQTYQELSKPIIEGKLKYDDIDQSRLLKADKERWYKYIKGSYQKAPTKNSPEGHTTSFNAVFDAATLQLSPKEAYDVLLEARFNDRSITNEQFEWAVDKIENPYQKHVLEDLQATLKSNTEDFNRLFKFDNERNKKVNEALISWVDELVKQDKVPVYDFKKKMAAMSSAFRAGGGRWYDIGRIIEQGGRQWEIVGFADDGEPLVEEVP